RTTHMEISWAQLLIGLAALVVAILTLQWRLEGSREKRLMSLLDEKFENETKQRHITEGHINAMVEDAKRDTKKNEIGLQRVQREVLELRAELPERYVRREDYIRGQTVIESKLDSLAIRMENNQLR